MFCRKCGTELKDEWQVCPNCGEPVNKTTDSDTKPEEKIEPTSKKPLYKDMRVWIVVAVAICLVLVGVILGRGSGKEDTKKSSKKTEQAKNTGQTNETKENNDPTEISGDLYTDVEKQLLYANDQGQITDKEGNVLDVYSNIGVEDSCLYDMSDDTIAEGLFVDDDGMVYYEQPEETEFDDRPEIEKLRDKADPNKCDNDVEPAGDTTRMGDDGDYFDEVVLGAWFNEDGTSKAVLFPERLSTALLNNGDMSTSISNFHFLDGVTYSMDDLKRSTNPQGWDLSKDCYGIIMQGVEKSKNSKGEIIYTGFDPCSNEYVVLHGDFKGVLNGDDLLVFTKFYGLAEDDTVNFTGGYVQIINGRL